jgi:hypothetical protein
MKKGTVVLGFRIMKDGKIAAALHYVASSGDAALDQAAHDGVASSSPVQPLPKEFVCEYVALQFHFYYTTRRCRPHREGTTLSLCQKCGRSCQRSEAAVLGHHYGSNEIHSELECQGPDVRRPIVGTFLPMGSTLSFVAKPLH